MERRPNILWICTDQQRFDTLGCYGNPFVKSPNIDALAASGVQFENAFCQNPVCTPSRASFLTGRYPHVTRARQNGQEIPADERLISRILADDGYSTGLSGKLHLAACHPSVGIIRDPWLDHGYNEFHWSHHSEPDYPANDYANWLRENGATYGRKSFDDSPYVETSTSAELHQTTWCASKAINFIEARQGREEPWLFSVNIYDPHHPFDPPLEYLKPYLDRLDEIPLPNYVQGELDNKPMFQQHDHKHNEFYNVNGMSPRDHRLIRAAYWAMCDLIDAQVGRMVDALKRTGQLENTIVIFMSDHGEMLGDHGIYTKGPYVYDCAIHVPLIISMPGTIQVGVKARGLMELTDITPTLIEAVGKPRDIRMQGQSIWPMLTGETAKLRDDVYCEYYESGSPKYEGRRAFVTMIRTQTHKLAVAHGLETGELYDLQNDPNETKNLWASATHRDIKLSLMQRLCDRMAWTADPAPQRIALW